MMLDSVYMVKCNIYCLSHHLVSIIIGLQLVLSLLTVQCIMFVTIYCKAMQCPEAIST